MELLWNLTDDAQDMIFNTLAEIASMTSVLKHNGNEDEAIADIVYSFPELDNELLFKRKVSTLKQAISFIRSVLEFSLENLEGI